MSTRAKITLGVAIVLSSLTVWGVHYQQNQERESMYKGVLKDDERRLEKMKQRQQDFEESKRKHELYERVQPVREDTGGS
ncbi:hypothetical protein GYMLUDRAFT_182538 [Collybiopsis luxurians FD-317 M1]|uniref:Cytochrome c oxidase assembly protein COX16, mitochondrial n=1 Tax=Collybiopsis luxurians FD-317 M1 TaxID=944289 RepID=A0A0D0C776_9AGAR|nr:hypothetical protein GYMLUDRAFT_182538 [Collybiopsis luxurians FD-317 M1]